MPWFMGAALVLSGYGMYQQEQSMDQYQKNMDDQLDLARESFEFQKAQATEQMAMLKEDRAWWEENMQGQLEVYDESMTQLGDILSGDMDIASSPMFSNYYASLNKDFEVQKQQLLESVPQGGNRDRMLTELNRAYMDNRASLTGEIKGQVFNWATQVGLPTGKPGTGVQGAQYSPVPISQPNTNLDLSGLYYLAGSRGEKSDTGSTSTSGGTK